MALPEISWKELTQEELDLLSLKLSEETTRRSQINALPDTIDAMIRDLKRFEGFEEGIEWVRPDSATRAYPRGWTTVHNGKQWKSTLSGNLAEPGTTGWIEIPSADNRPQKGEK